MLRNYFYQERSAIIIVFRPVEGFDGRGKKEGSGCGFSAAKWIYFAVLRWILRLCLLIISMLCAENICVFGKWRARTVGRTRYVERVRGRSGRIGGCVGNGQATCGHDGRQACGRSGDSDGFGGYGRLGCGWRVCGRVRPAGGGGAARKLPYLGILCVRTPEIFLQKAGSAVRE